MSGTEETSKGPNIYRLMVNFEPGQDQETGPSIDYIMYSCDEAMEALRGAITMGKFKSIAFGVYSTKGRAGTLSEEAPVEKKEESPVLPKKKRRQQTMEDEWAD